MSYIFKTDAPPEILLKHVQGKLTPLFEKACPDWTSHPQGYLAKYWTSLNWDSINLLFYILLILEALQSKLTKKSKEKLLEKVRFLLTYDQKKFDELLLELEVGLDLAVQPGIEAIAIEPLTLLDNNINANNPSSPDYAIRLADGDLFVEVTVSYNQVLNDWEGAMGVTADWIQDKLKESPIKKAVVLKFPLTPTLKDWVKDKKNFRPILNGLAISNEGHRQIIIDNKLAIISWNIAQPTVLWKIPTQDGSVSKVKSPESSIRWSMLNIDPKYSEKITFNSIDSTLRHKKDQFKILSEQAPLILAIRANHYRLNYENVLGLIHHRIWHKPPELGYNRFSGVFMILPRTLPGIRTLATAETPQVKASLNPRAMYLVSRNFREIFQLDYLEESEPKNSNNGFRLSCFD